jgi:hypothetical protein
MCQRTRSSFLLVVGNADDEFAAIKRKVVELHIEAFAVFLCPGCADIVPAWFVALTAAGDAKNAMAWFSGGGRVRSHNATWFFERARSAPLIKTMDAALTGRAPGQRKNFGGPSFSLGLGRVSGPSLRRRIEISDIEGETVILDIDGANLAEHFGDSLRSGVAGAQ